MLVISCAPCRRHGGTFASALPPAKLIAAAPIHALADKLNVKNWQTVKKELLKLAN
ncbi:MAG: hypothetical protein Q8O57_06760 [Kiritimatiellota bacterium]|nr:hypothetical protein [Kiritimatiellota bacterium]